MRVLIAEDDVATARGISLALKAASIVVDHTDLGEEAFELARTYDYDLVMLGAGLPDISGLEVLRRMRAAQQTTPVLMLVPEKLVHLKIKAYSLGTDDIMVTPVDHDELIARLQAIVRRSVGIADPVTRVGELHINFSSHEVFYIDQRLHLTGKEFAILELLVLRRGMVLTKDAFLNHLYGGMDEPEAKIIDVFICKLRKKLQAAGAPEIISTVWGRGYTIHEERAEPALSSKLAAPVPVHRRESAV